MTALNLVQLVVATLLPPVAACILYMLEKKSAFARVGYMTKQVIFGAIFGGIAVMGTEFGIQISGAVVNVRDAAVICAGLFFGAPAGIIAGVIGGVERWFAVLWGAGAYTRLACTLGTMLAGFISAGLRKWLFDDKKAGWGYSLVIGLVVEMLHLLLVFVTNMDNVSKAYNVLRICSAPMLICNSLSVMIASVALSVISRSGKPRLERSKGISQTIQRWLLIVVLIGLIVTNLFGLQMQNNLAIGSAEEKLELYTSDVKTEITDASDSHLVTLAVSVRDKIQEMQKNGEEVQKWDLNNMQVEYNLSEVSIIDENGIIVQSTGTGFVGFDMSSGKQAAAFLDLLDGDPDTFVQAFQPMTRNDKVSMKYAGAALKGGGFVQVGFSAARFQKEIDDEITGITKYRHIGTTGYMMIIDSKHNVVSETNGREDINLKDEGFIIDECGAEGTLIKTKLYGEDVHLMYTTTEGYYIVAVIPNTELMNSRDISVYVTSFMETLVFAVLFALIYWLIKRLVVENIHKVNQSLAQISSGNLNEVVNVRSNEEFAALSDDINSTVTTLKRYIAEAAARIDKELHFANVIQASVLPSSFPAFPGRNDFDIYASMTPAKEVGGDFYDFYMLPGDRLAYLVADVSGKGISAAMFMMTAKTLIKSLAEKEPDVSKVLTDANAELCRNNEAEMFVTCWMGIIDLNTGVVTYSNAGHNPPAVRHQGGDYEFLTGRHSFVLAGMDGVRYRKSEFTLAPGDEIFIYTDGVTEATDAHNELFGDPRLLESLNAHKGLDSMTLCKTVRADIDAFVGEAPQFDDITMLSLKISPKDVLELKPEDGTQTQVDEFLEAIYEREGVPMKTVFKMNVAVDEMYSNIIYYSKATSVKISCTVKDRNIELVFSDNGVPFDPLSKKDPDTTLSAEDRDIGGLGILMVKKTMDSVDYKYINGQNILTLTKKF